MLFVTVSKRKRWLEIGQVLLHIYVYIFFAITYNTYSLRLLCKTKNDSAEALIFVVGGGVLVFMPH